MSLEISEVKGSYWLFSFLKRCNASSSSGCRDNWLRGMSPQLKAVMDGAPAPAAFICQLAETSYTHWTTPLSVSLLNNFLTPLSTSNLFTFVSAIHWKPSNCSLRLKRWESVMRRWLYHVGWITYSCKAGWLTSFRAWASEGRWGVFLGFSSGSLWRMLDWTALQIRYKLQFPHPKAPEV